MFVTIGSGLLPHVGPSFPTISGQFSEGTYPVPNSTDNLRTLQGMATVVINPEDFSVHIGLSQQAISVGTSVTPLPLAAFENRRALVIHNNGPNILYIGASNVTTSNGFPLAVDEKIAIMVQGHNGVTVYGISSATTDVRILELS
jgi:hypothetical protein